MRLLKLTVKIISVYSVMYLFLSFIQMDFVNILKAPPEVRLVFIIPILVVLFVNLMPKSVD